MSIQIGDPSPADLEPLARVAAECGLDVDFSAELSRPYALLRVARSRTGEVCGFLLAWRAADELHLTDLGVTAAWRRRGVGRALVEELLREDSRVIFLEVRERNATALAFYASLGFSELDRRARYYSDTDEDAVVMQRNLR